MPIVTPLRQLLNVSLPETNSATALSTLFSTGLPKSTLTELCKLLGLSERDFTNKLLIEAPRKPDVALSFPASDAVFRVSRALYALQAKNGWAPKDAATWLKTPSSMLKGRAPLDLLATSIGCEYVTTAISRT